MTSPHNLAKSVLALRNRMRNENFACGSMWVCCTHHWVIPNFYVSETEAKSACEKLLEENITAIPKRVNITITFPNSQGDIS